MLKVPAKGRKLTQVTTPRRNDLNKLNYPITLTVFLVYFSGSVSWQSSWEAVQRRGDSLRRPDHPHIPEPLPAGTPGVPVGSKPVRLSQPAGGEAVCPDGAPPHQL